MQTQSYHIGQYLSDQLPDCSEVAINGCNVEQCLSLLIPLIYLHNKKILVLDGVCVYPSCM